MWDLLREPELALQEARAAGGVDDPARLHLLVGFGLGVVDRVPAARVEVDLADAAALQHIDPEPARTRRQLVLEQPPVDLKIVLRRELGRPEFDPLADVGVVVRRREEAEAELDQVALFEVGLEPDHLREVVRPRRHGRFAHLERRQRRRPLALLEHHNRGVLRARASTASRASTPPAHHPGSQRHSSPPPSAAAPPRTETRHDRRSCKSFHLVPAEHLRCRSGVSTPPFGGLTGARRLD